MVTYCYKNLIHNYSQLIFLCVGNPKGQGQEKNVLYNRQQKNVKKAKQANHNRRSGAQWKRNQGMVPS